jgi:hypothetical protein
VNEDVKQQIRDRVWRTLEEKKAARWPGARGRIPNFVGAEAAAERLASMAAWKRARWIKANPDAPQLAVRVCGASFSGASQPAASSLAGFRRRGPRLVDRGAEARTG